MADPKDPKDPAHKADPKTGADGDTLSLKEELENAKTLLQEKDKAIRELSESNEDLTAELKERQKNSDLELALKENKALLRQVTAGKVRELIQLGLDRGQFKRDDVRGYDGGDDRSDALTLSWFKNSMFEGDMEKLKFALKRFPKTEMRRSFVSGEPTGTEGAGYTAQQEQELKAAGKDPKIVAAVRGARNFTEFKRLKQAAAKE